MTMRLKTSHALVPLALAALAFAACGKKPEEQAATAPDAAAEQQAQEQAQQEAAIKAREEELNRREQEIALKEKEKELADREAALAKASAPKPASKPAASASTSAAPKPAPVPVAAGPKDYVIPAGTSLSVQLPAEISTKTAKKGQRISGNLTQDLVVNGKVVAKAGALVQGSVTQVISGSKTIGGTPTLALDFDSITSEGGDRPMNARVTQVAEKSDKAGDTAKIAGGAAVGGVVGHQISHKNGAIIGALIGAAAGTAAAKNTGKEVVLPAGTVVGLTLESPVTVTM
jgi:hypothetical protein